MSSTVIVFGPTGNVGSHVARTAYQSGSKVYLAMRDTSKAIPGLSAEQEKQGGFERVTADLTKPDSVAEAVKQSGATRAFIYLAHHSQDAMKSTLEALKTAGIDTIVFLSSYTITRPPAEVPSEELIPYWHAQVEVNLETVFGPKNYVAIRPGAFATNSAAWYRPGIKAGEIKLFAPDIKFDWTPAADMGGVAGVILAKGTQDGAKIVYVFGPQFLSQRGAIDIIQKEALEKPVKITIVEDAEEQVQILSKVGMPPPIASYITDVMVKRSQGGNQLEFAKLEEGQQNVQKYLNRPGVTFEEYVRENKADFL